MRQYVALCQARSGSTLIAESLRQHPGVRMFGEIFNAKANDRQRYFSVEGRAWREDEDSAAFMRDVVFRERDEVAAVGFKLMYSDVWRGAAAGAWAHLVEHKDVRVVHIVRDNLLAALISLQLARRTNEWAIHSDSGASPTLVPPFSLDPESCRRFFEEHERWTRAAREALTGHAYLELEYARDIDGRLGDAMDRLWPFLGAPPCAVRERLRKQSVRTPRQQLDNYDSLKKYFANTGYSRFFAD